MDHTELPLQTTPYLPLPCERSPDGATWTADIWFSSLLIYRLRKDERLSWPSWLTYSGRCTHISGHTGPPLLWYIPCAWTIIQQCTILKQVFLCQTTRTTAERWYRPICGRAYSESCRSAGVGSCPMEIGPRGVPWSTGPNIGKWCEPLINELVIWASDDRWSAELPTRFYNQYFAVIISKSTIDKR